MLHRRPGRPVQIAPERRVEMVLDAAQALLAEHPLADVTMTAIAARAGMSKRTLYGMFDSREALLEACIARLTRSIFRPLEEDDRARPLEHRLKRLLTLNTGPETELYALELLRSLIAEASSFSALARRTCEESFDTLARNVTVELHEGLRRGEIVDLPAERLSLAARIVIDMACVNPLPFLLNPQAPKPTREQKAARRDWAVEIFLNGLGRK
ncbi:MAG: TetR/AcrR family transcriptional regulator [Tropicimonas sp.]